MESMNPPLQQVPTASILTGPVFDCIASVSTATLSTLIDALAFKGEVGALRTALSAGHARVDAVNRAVSVLTGLTANSAAPKNVLGQEEIGELMDEWLVEAAAGYGKKFLNAVFEHMEQAGSKVGPDIFKVLKRIGADFEQLLPTPRESVVRNHCGEHGGKTVLSSALAQRISTGSLDIVAEMIQTPIERFPVTIRVEAPNDGSLVRQFNLAEHMVAASNAPSVAWKWIVDLLPDGQSESKYELGDLVMKMLDTCGTRDLQHATKWPDTAIDAVWRDFGSGMSHAGKQSYLSHMVVLLAAGAQFREPAESWARLIEGGCSGRPLDKETSAIPIWASLPLIGMMSASNADAIKTLGRFVSEGTLSADAQFEGETMLQRAAQHGRMQLVVALLDLGADPNKCGDTQSMLPAVLAQEQGFPDIAAAITSRSARVAMQSVSSGARNTAIASNQ